MAVQSCASTTTPGIIQLPSWSLADYAVASRSALRPETRGYIYVEVGRPRRIVSSGRLALFAPRRLWRLERGKTLPDEATVAVAHRLLAIMAAPLLDLFTGLAVLGRKLRHVVSGTSCSNR